MKRNEILDEICQTREDLARANGHDLKRLFEYVQGCEQKAADRGMKFVSFAEAGESFASVRERAPENLTASPPVNSRKLHAENHAFGLSAVVWPNRKPARRTSRALTHGLGNAARDRSF